MTQTPRAMPSTALPDYERDPAAIYRASFRAVREATDLSAVPAALHPLALRLVHACGLPEIVHDLAYSPNAGAAGETALREGATVLTDAQMVASGVVRDRLPGGNQVLCLIDDARTHASAKAQHGTRAAAAVDLWSDWLPGAVVAIGNAPTALFRLLEHLRDGAPRPALILGFPVGFIGAAESKQALIDCAPALDVDYVTLRGRFGGSALAAAAVNALAAPEAADR